MKDDYLKRILSARVYDVAIESPLERAAGISEQAGNQVLLKREDMQPVFSFKLRGAYNKMAHLTPAELKRGVICASAGNHAQGVALAAQKLGCKATIVMPVTTPAIKIDAVARRGAQVVLHGDSYHEASLHAKQLSASKKLTYVHPYDDPLVIAGQGTIGMEILRQHQHPIDAVFVPIGGGGLIAGIGAYIKALSPSTKIIGVEPVDSNAMYQSLKANKRVTLSHVNLFADGVAVKQVGEETFRLVKQLVDEVVLVSTDEICAAIKDIFQDTRSVMEPSGGLALAGIKRYVERDKIKGKTLVAICCGANMNFDRLRFVAERAEVGEHHEALLAVTVPETRGSRCQCGASVRRRADCRPQRGKKNGRRFQSARVQDPGFVRRRNGQAAYPPSGGRAFTIGRKRKHLPLRISGASRRADALPEQHEPQLEYQPVSLPQSRRGCGTHPGGIADPRQRARRLRQVPEDPGLRVCG